MTDFSITSTAEFATALDFIRFGLSCAFAQKLYYGHGTDNAPDDIRSLILESLNLPFDVDPLLLHGRLTPAEKQLLTEQLKLRIEERVPVPYLTHKAYFCGLEFYVDKRVLITLSPIAELIQSQFSPWIEPEEVVNILDLCTGSGCIAIACAYAFPNAEVDGVDISRDALAVAEINCERHGLETQIQLIESDCFSALSQKRYDIIVSNPPYVSDEELSILPREYDHEPKLALVAKRHGLAIVEKILSDAADYLTDHGILVVEVGNSEEALIAAFPDVPFMWLEFEHGGHGVFVLTRLQLETYFAVGSVDNNECTR